MLTFLQVQLGRNLHKELRREGGEGRRGGSRAEGGGRRGGGDREAHRAPGGGAKQEEEVVRWQNGDEEEEEEEEEEGSRLPSNSPTFTFSPETIGPGPQWYPTVVSSSTVW